MARGGVAELPNLWVVMGTKREQNFRSVDLVFAPTPPRDRPQDTHSVFTGSHPNMFRLRIEPTPGRCERRLHVHQANSDLVMSGVHRAQAVAATPLGARDEYLCWSRMQAEAGQQLDAIIARKELERSAGHGVFMWGVGNAPALITNVLARADLRIPVIFSVMKSRPKSLDVSPSRTFAWRSYFDADDVQQPLPVHVVITSRGDSATGAKRSHYALMCYSSVPLRLRLNGRPFDPSAYCNAGGAGAPVGASQVTALLRRVKPTNPHAGDYRVDLSAWLTGSFWVRLGDPVELSEAALGALQAAPSLDEAGWLKLASEIRRGEPESKTPDAQASFSW